MAFSEADFESPGFEYLRLYQNMSNLYSKLVALNYRSQFCGAYKCPPIHRHYFAVASKNPAEQRFIFTCLCAWLIKDKCQMNFKLEPQEYENLDDTLSTIREAMELLLLDSADSNEHAEQMTITKQRFNLSSSRLAEGHGPEVVWTLNTFADRALEVSVQEEDSKPFRIVYSPRVGPGENGMATKTSSGQTSGSGDQAGFISIGQPFVGGGLTTRPLGSYKVDDPSLVFSDDDDDDDDEDSMKSSSFIENQPKGHQERQTKSSIDPDSWYKQVEQSRDTLENMRKTLSATLIDGKSTSSADWGTQLKLLMGAANALAEFKQHSGTILAQGASSLAGQLKTIAERENILKNILGDDIEDYLRLMRKEAALVRRKEELSSKVDQTTRRFEQLNQQLAQNEAQINQRIVELNDGSRLRQLKSVISDMELESSRMDLEIGLLLTVYTKRHDHQTP